MPSRVSDLYRWCQQHERPGLSWARQESGVLNGACSQRSNSYSSTSKGGLDLSTGLGRTARPPTGPWSRTPHPARAGAAGECGGSIPWAIGPCAPAPACRWSDGFGEGDIASDFGASTPGASPPKTGASGSSLGRSDDAAVFVLNGKREGEPQEFLDRPDERKAGLERWQADWLQPSRLSPNRCLAGSSSIERERIQGHNQK
jgi:hypothetical protein